MEYFPQTWLMPHETLSFACLSLESIVKHAWRIADCLAQLGDLIAFDTSTRVIEAAARVGAGVKGVLQQKIDYKRQRSRTAGRRHFLEISSRLRHTRYTLHRSCAGRMPTARKKRLLTPRRGVGAQTIPNRINAFRFFAPSRMIGILRMNFIVVHLVNARFPRVILTLILTLTRKYVDFWKKKKIDKFSSQF